MLLLAQPKKSIIWAGVLPMSAAAVALERLKEWKEKSVEHDSFRQAKPSKIGNSCHRLPGQPISSVQCWVTAKLLQLFHCEDRRLALGVSVEGLEEGRDPGHALEGDPVLGLHDRVEHAVGGPDSC